MIKGIISAELAELRRRMLDLSQLQGRAGSRVNRALGMASFRSRRLRGMVGGPRSGSFAGGGAGACMSALESALGADL